MAASSSTAAYSSSSFDVFLSHRGRDTKKTFASHLYRRLILHGLRVFLDYEELQEGDDINFQIKGVIQTASVHVAILSPGYAESAHCLDELRLMFESNAPVVPVFYGVNPSQVRQTRRQCSIYCQALQRLEMQYDSTIIERWRNALSVVASISGFELDKYNGDEEELLQKVVEAVLRRVQWKATDTFVAQYRVGMDEKIEDFENVLFKHHHQSLKPQIVGIVGLGGVGKTTLAKEFFFRNRSCYRRSCFLSNVRENAAKGILTSLQSQLLKILAGSDALIDNTVKGKEALKKHLSSYSVLVVLDDVDALDQIDALLPVRTDLLPDSLIVITSRDKGVITNSGVENGSIYQLTGLNKEHSLELFCAYAFTQPSAPEGFESLVQKLLEFCVGLPLFLKVFGALLSQTNEQSEWEEVLDRLHQESPNDIEKSIRISYDSLNTEQQQMFLDCACFLRGHKKDTAIRIWDGSGWVGRMGFQTLQDRCLLEVDIENNIHMHDHLRDFGRVLSVTLSPRRLWQCTHINDILEQFSVTTVRGVKMVPGDYKDDVAVFGGIDMGSLQLAMSTLQLVDTENAILESPIHFPSLVWLRWNKCPKSSLASCIPVENLAVLQVSGSELTTLWDDESQAPLQLREIEINAPLFNIPKSIGQLKHLERIVVGSFLSGRVNLTELPKEFCELQSLKELVLTDCSRLELLPYSFGRLTALQHIDLSFCRNLVRLPHSFGCLRKLQHINLSECHDLESLPDSIDGLRRLQHIDLRGCHNLKSLPDSFGDLRDLRHINLSGCHDLGELPDRFGDLRYLQHINLQGCHNLKNLPNTFGDLVNLQHINLSNCYDLRSLTDSFGKLKNLTYIDLSGCHNLERLPYSLRNLIKLTHLDVDGCSNLTIETLELSAGLQMAQRQCLEQLYLSDEEHQKRARYEQGCMEQLYLSDEEHQMRARHEERCMEQVYLS